jgi:hypothetical protein
MFGPVIDRVSMV